VSSNTQQRERRQQRQRKDPDVPLTPDGLYSPRQVSRFEAVCIATLYVRLARGEYECFKDGDKKTVITASASRSVSWIASA
jgi:hypothetical protein